MGYRRTYWKLDHEVTVEEMLELEARGGVRFAVIDRGRRATPTLAVLLEPRAGDSPAHRDNWERSGPFEVSAGEFAKALEEFDCRLIATTSGHFKVGWTKEHRAKIRIENGWRRRMGREPLPGRSRARGRS
jgi:hypothetical protein